MIRAARTKGSKKWRLKKRLRVGLATENPPHNKATMELPSQGMAEKRLVITTEPHRDFCPLGRT